ncbi:MFS general substrate transporter [Glarea lozoyensis ATCC 20868]|uniref:MFS general substrate transporter n=1 Tax=Glarea lozoyensis (strain ATCC 20868 / MF5171) TaxID=1116229 RepID=S3CTU1_GLAL2|nr:MFS general substrate transporter [Glarea lozoyensis ATCC 20868]EPE29782.1 MFS general substrate transporter [Glarea lozoyensis ATCC 20868]
MAVANEPRMSTEKVVDVEKGSETPATTDVAIKEEDIQYPTGQKLVLLMVALYLCMFIVALDRTIIGTAIPKITDDFKSIGDVGWYASSYLITMCAFQLIYGRIYTFYSPKWVLLYAIAVFEIGSAICGAAPNSVAFIIGRSISGLGSAGIFSGVVIIMVFSVPLAKRPVYQGLFGAVFGIASVTGPLLGGVFTTKVSWRWCFYINLPIGAVVVAIVILILDLPPTKNKDSLKEQFFKLDPYGTAVFLPGVVCLLLALQWGGTVYAWKSARIIALIILAAFLLVVFAVIQVKSGDRATVPIRIIKQRSIIAGACSSFINAGSMMITIYYLPIWFQAIKGYSAVKSGVDTLPLVLALVAASIVSGGLTAKTGYYTGQLIASSIISSVGAGLLTTLKVSSPKSTWIGFQFLYGFGLGLGMQQPGMAAQTVLEHKDVMTGVSIMFLFQGLGGAIWVSVGQTVFNQALLTKFSHIANLNVAQIVNTGATEIRHLVDPAMLPEVLVAYNGALMDILKVAAALSAAAIIGGLTMEWRSVKNKNGAGVKKNVKAEKSVEPSNEQENGSARTSRNSVVDPELNEKL